MPKLYRTQPNDTFTALAQRFYGDPARSAFIRSTNGFRPSQVLPVGIIINIVEIPSIQKTKITPKILTSDIDEVSIIINGVQLLKFRAFNVVRTFGTLADGFSINAVWNSESQELRELFRPYSYHPTQIIVGQEKIIEGILETSRFISNDQAATSVILSGRTRTSPLVDSDIDVFPLEFNTQNLQNIARTVIEPYGLTVEFKGDPGPVFERVRATLGESPFSFLNRLARIRGFLITSDIDGQVVFLRADISSPSIDSLEEGFAPVMGGDSTYDGTMRFSSFRALAQSPGVNEISAVERDTAIIGAVRPKIVMTNSVSQGNVSDSAKWARSRSQGNSIGINLKVSGWRDKNGNLWKENTKISASYPSQGIYNPSDFIISSVEYRGDSDQSRSTVLGLSIPETYTLNEPEGHPWDL